MAPPHEDSSIAAAADKSEKELLVECLNRLSDFVLESRPKPPDPATIRSDKLEKLYGFVIQVRTAMLQLYSYGLDDSFILKELSNIKEAVQSLKTFLEEAIAAESRVIHYKDAVDCSHALDHATEISMSSDITG